MNINEWVLSKEWRHGKVSDSIVCDEPPKIRDHIIEIHNNALRGDETTSQGDGRD